MARAYVSAPPVPPPKSRPILPGAAMTWRISPPLAVDGRCPPAATKPHRRRPAEMANWFEMGACAEALPIRPTLTPRQTTGRPRWWALRPKCVGDAGPSPPGLSPATERSISTCRRPGSPPKKKVEPGQSRGRNASTGPPCAGRNLAAPELVSNFPLASTKTCLPCSETRLAIGRTSPNCWWRSDRGPFHGDSQAPAPDARPSPVTRTPPGSKAA